MGYFGSTLPHLRTELVYLLDELIRVLYELAYLLDEPVHVLDKLVHLLGEPIHVLDKLAYLLGEPIHVLDELAYLLGEFTTVFTWLGEFADRVYDDFKAGFDVKESGVLVSTLVSTIH